MAIAQSKYINIISSASGGNRVAQRDLIGRVFTANILVPVGHIIEFSGGAAAALQAIGEYFGITSKEYKFALKYFQVNKTGGMPQKLSFSRITPAAVSATLIGTVNASTLNELQSITAGDLTISINGEAHTYESINLSGATSFAEVATLISNAMTDNGANISYESTLGRFVVSTAETGATQNLSFGTGNLAIALGLVEGRALLSDGADATSIPQSVIDSEGLNNNFFTFYILDQELSISDYASICMWNAAQNVKYIFCGDVTPENASAVVDGVKSYAGAALTLNKFNDMPSAMPMSRMASIDFTKPNSAISMNFQQFTGFEPSVLTTVDSNFYDSLRINYYGATQQAGQIVAWYQPGLLQGDIPDMGVYANEAWMKDSFFADLLNLRLGLNSLPANQTGVSLVLGVLMNTINMALTNGTILPGKVLSEADKTYITQLTNDDDAWKKVQTSGYYLTADLERYNENGISKFKVSYLLIYSKGDSINYIDGRDILI